jgi:hypothetical protein
MLRHLKDQALPAVIGLERIENFRQMVIKLHVHDGADDLGNFALGLVWHQLVSVPFKALRRLK